MNREVAVGEREAALGKMDSAAYVPKKLFGTKMTLRKVGWGASTRKNTSASEARIDQRKLASIQYERSLICPTHSPAAALEHIPLSLLKILLW